MQEIQIPNKFLVETPHRNFSFNLNKGFEIKLIVLTKNLKQENFLCELDEGSFYRLKLLEENIRLELFSSGKGTFYGSLLKEVGVCGVELFLGAFFHGFVKECVFSKTQR